MIKAQTFATDNQQSIIKLFLIFIISVTLLFLGMSLTIIIPKIDRVFEELNSNADQIAAESLAGELEQYLLDRELALKDISSNALISNVALSGDINPAFLDYIDQLKVLGENPKVTVIDAVGNIIHSELLPNHDKQHDATIDIHWSLPLLQAHSDGAISDDSVTNRAIVEITEKPRPSFNIAVPIIYGRKSEGILVAKISAKPNLIFDKGRYPGKELGTVYEKNNKSISTDLSQIKEPQSKTVGINAYGMQFTYITDHADNHEKKNGIVKSFVYSNVIGGLCILILLILLGKKVLVKPLQDLAGTQQAIASAVEGIAYVSSQGRYVSVNQAYASMLGFDRHYLVGEAPSITVHKDDQKILEKQYYDMLQSGKASTEVRGVKQDGTVFYQRITMISEHDEKEQFKGYHYFTQDITETKLKDELAKKSQNELQLIFDNVPVKIWYKDDKNTILRLNQRAAESMGGTVKDFEGKSAYDLFPQMAKKYHDDDLAVVNSGKPLLGIIEEYTPANEPTAWVRTDKIPYTNPTTKESFLFVCAQDITSLKAAEKAKDQLVAKLSYTNEELEKFAYIASHDLKAPLRGIEQLANWLQTDCESILPAESTKHLHLMISRVGRMGLLLDDLLAYSRVNKMELSQDQVNLNDVFENILDLNVAPFAFKTTLNVPSHPVSIARKPLEIIMRNLLDNAVKHHDTGKGVIEISYQMKDNCHVIEVRDDGPGIDPILHETAFEMFKTLKPRDEVEGSGMGLAIIRKILLRYNGTISIDSDGKRGTLFTIIWPTAQTSTAI